MGNDMVVARPTSGLAVGNQIDQMGRLARIFAQSGMFSDVRDATQAMVKIWAGDELGFSAFQSMTGINIIKGKLTMAANLIASAIKRSRKYDFTITRHDDQVCEADFYELVPKEIVETRPDGAQIVTKTRDKIRLGASVFSMADARKAGLSGNNWSSYPRNMLFARMISNGAKWYCADVFGGPVYTPDEIGAQIDGNTGELINHQPPQPRQIGVVDLETPEVVEGEMVGGPIDTLKATFAKVNVTEEMLVKYLGHPLAEITPSEVAALRKMYGSLASGEAKLSDFFFPSDLDSIQAGTPPKDSKATVASSPQPKGKK